MASLSARIGGIHENDPTPLYVQLQRVLRRAMHDNKLDADRALPPERELAEDFGVSRITVRKALAGLAEEGLLDRRRGAGTFVAPPTNRIEKSFSKLSSFTEDMLARGLTPDSKMLSQGLGTVTPEEALMMGLSPGTPVYRFSRVRYANEAPMAVEYTTVRASCLPANITISSSLYVELDRTGNRPVRALQRLRAVAFEEEHAKLLGVKIGAPGLLIERHSSLADGRPIEITRSYYRGDAYDFVAELQA